MQATHIERRDKYAQDENSFSHSEDHFKGKGMDKRIDTTNKDGNKMHCCTNYEKYGHDE